MKRKRFSVEQIVAVLSAGAGLRFSAKHFMPSRVTYIFSLTAPAYKLARICNLMLGFSLPQCAEGLGKGRCAGKDGP